MIVIEVIMTRKVHPLKYVGIVLAILIILVPTVSIPLGLYFSTAPPSIDISYNYDTVQEKSIIHDLEKISTTSSYYSYVEFKSGHDIVRNISEMLLEADTKVRRILREFELSYSASLSAFSNNNLTQFNTTELSISSMILSYYNSTDDRYYCIANIPSLINDKIQIINNTGLLDDGYYFITHKLDELERRDFLSTIHTSIERKIICNNVGQPLLIITFERCVTMS